MATFRRKFFDSQATPPDAYSSSISKTDLNQRKDTSVAKCDAPRKRDASPTFPRFMELPPEIRIMIYDRALTVPGRINPYPTLADEKENAFAVQCERPAVALLQTNKQIRAEAQPSLYNNNVWVISYQLNPSIPRAIYDDKAEFFVHIAFSLDPRDITVNERKVIRTQVNTALLDNSLPSGMVYTTVDQFRFLAWANRQTFLTLVLAKIRIMQSIYRHKNLCSIHVDATATKNPVTGERKDMFKAISEVVDPNIWGNPLPRAMDDRDQAKWAIVEKVLRDPVRITKADRRTLVIAGITESEVKILTRWENWVQRRVDAGGRTAQS
ncbi:MAG: hypothetical protein Q9212_007368 [Teloschistes hypoglaucus]